jgi:dodecin
MVILAVDSTARPFECDIGEKPNILAGYREFNPRAPRTTGMERRASPAKPRAGAGASGVAAAVRGVAQAAGYAACGTTRSRRNGARRGPRGCLYFLNTNKDQRRKFMSEHVYKQIELTGSSTKSIEDAVSTAIAKASKTLRNLHWFEVIETRGQIEDDKVAYWQVTIKVGLRIE